MKKSGISLLGLVFIVFLVLKLTNTGEVAKWNWWQVTAPLWLPASLVIFVVVILVAFSIFFEKDN